MRLALAGALCALASLTPSSGMAQAQPSVYGPHTYNLTILRANNLRRDQPATSWEQPIERDAADLIEYLGPDRILIGLMDLSRLGEPNHEEIVLVNARDGATIWTSPARLRYYHGSYSLIRTTPHLIVLGADASLFNVFALDSATGRQVWRYIGRGPFRLGTVGADRLLVLSRDGRRHKLESVEAATGRVAWRHDVDERVARDSTEPRLLVAGDTVFVVGRAVAELDAATGTMRRTLEPRAGDDAPNAFLAPAGLVLWNARAVELLDRRTGASRWVVNDSSAGIARLVTSEGDDLLRVGHRQAERGTFIDRIAGADGARAWRLGMRGFVVSPIASSGDLRVVATDSVLVGFDVSSGEPRFQELFPAAFAADGPSFAPRIGVPDQVRTQDGRLFLARERAGVIAYQLPEGRLLWFQPAYERPLPLVDYTAQGRYEALLSEMQVLGRAGPGAPPSLSVQSQNPARPSVMLQSAQQEYQAARTRYEAVRSNAAASSGDRAAAADRLRFASEQQLAATQVDVATGRMAASVGFGAAALNFAVALAEAQRQRALGGLESRMVLAVQGGARAWQRVFQGDYYVRPFFKRGRGVTLVSLSTGRRRDIVVSPQNEVLMAVGLDLPEYTLGPNGRLTAVGISLRSDRYRDLGQWKNTRAPNVAILNYDLATVEFAERTRDWSSIVEAVKAADTALVRVLLDRGEVDVNSRHWAAGETALMFAAALGRVDIAQYLVSRGANVNLLSDWNQTALDITRLDPMRNWLRSVGGKTAAELAEAPSRN